MRRLVVPMCLSLLAQAGCENQPFPPDPTETTDAQLRQTLANWGVIPIGPMPAQNAAQVALGRALFFDKALSGNRDVACATCHEPALALGDGRPLPVGTGGTGIGPARTLGPGRGFVPRSSPTLLNAGLGAPYMFWDGRLTGFGPGPFLSLPDTVLLSTSNLLAAQAMLPVLNRVEMRGSPGDLDVLGNPNELAALPDNAHRDIWAAVMARLVAIPEYVQMFAAAFPGTATGLLRFHHAAEAIAAFEREAFTRTDSPFDRYLDRNDDALSADEKRGAELFFGEAQCGTCHNGPFLGAQNFANVGAPQIGPGVGSQMPLDLGRGEIDSFEFYRFAFRVAPLRNVELTAPYMHSGAYPTLEAVINHYNDVPTALQEYDVSQLPPELRDSYHGSDAIVAEIMRSVDFRLRVRQNFTEDEKRLLVAFLRSLTDQTARDLSDLVPTHVPSGLDVR